jgi:hypothetical protein
MTEDLRNKMIAKARENGTKHGKTAELDFGAGAEWMYEQLLLHVVIKRIEEYAPKPVEYIPFDETRKADFVYCVEWGINKAKRNEFDVYQKMLKELKEKYVL